MLPENEFLGLQIEARADGIARGYAFSSPGTKVAIEDFDWIFNGYGAVDCSGIVEMMDFYEVNRKVYTLAPVKGSAKDISDESRKEIHFDDSTSSGYFSELFMTLMDKGAVVRIIVGSTIDNTFGNGMIMLSLPEKMTLRMRTIISLAFPDLVATGIEVSGEDKGEKLLSDKSILDGITRFLFSMVCREFLRVNAEQRGIEKESEERFPGDACNEKSSKERNDGFSSIEDLNLSVRAYNSL